MKQNIAVLIFLIAFGLQAQNDETTFSQLKYLEGKWFGTIDYSNQDSKPINLSYSIRSNGSALVEQSNEGGVEMMTIFNLQNGKMLSTHYCGLKNRPVSELQSNTEGVISFKTNQKLSGLNSKKENFVGKWNLNLMPNKPDSFVYAYTVIGPEGDVFTATANMKRIK